MEQGSDAYKALLKKAQPWKGITTKKAVQEVRSGVRREMIWESVEENEAPVIPVFTSQ